MFTTAEISRLSKFVISVRCSRHMNHAAIYAGEILSLKSTRVIRA